MISGLVLKYLNGECFVIRRGYETTLPVSSSFCLTVPVAALVERWSGSERAIAAAWLHDTVEDCPPTSVAELEALFGKEIAGIVAELTDDKSLPKAERKKQQILNASKKSNEASLVKLADKTSNIGAIAQFAT